MGLYLIGSDNENEGEIVIAGIQLALGYWRDPERSSQAFRKFNSPEGTLLGYFTGDWAERLGGHLFFRERLDFPNKDPRLPYRARRGGGRNTRLRLARRMCPQAWRDAGCSD